MIMKNLLLGLSFGILTVSAQAAVASDSPQTTLLAHAGFLEGLAYQTGWKPPVEEKVSSPLAVSLTKKIDFPARIQLYQILCTPTGADKFAGFRRAKLLSAPGRRVIAD